LNAEKEKTILDQRPSEVQLNVFEYRNYRTALEAPHQKFIEKIVNRWAAQLVKGKVMAVDTFPNAKVYLDQDLLTLTYVVDFNVQEFLLRDIVEMEFASDDDGEFGQEELIVKFFDGDERGTLIFHFPRDRGHKGQSRERLSFALALRILRSRDPELLNDSDSVTVKRTGDSAVNRSAHKPTEVVLQQVRFNADHGIPVVFSVSDLRLFAPVPSTSRFTYLEFFVKYPSQEKYWYAKSPAETLQEHARKGPDERPKGKQTEDTKDKERENMRALADAKEPIAQIKFNLKNVKLKVPSIPHVIFGRLMAKDDYFPTALGTFEIQVDPTMVCDKRRGHERQVQPAYKPIDVTSAQKERVIDKDEAGTGEIEHERNIRVGRLHIRIIAYLTNESK